MLILAATPIGNLGDASLRLASALETVPVVAAEDTRTAMQLIRGLGIEARPELIALHEHNEREVAAQVVERARDEDVLVVTDAGMPAVSDPGFRVVQAAWDAGVQVTCLPGPSAVVVALALSGLPSDRFAFDGFVPRKDAARRAYFASLVTEQRTVVVFEAPHRLADTLAALAAELPERKIAVCRELTKKFEEVRRGTAAELLAWAQDGVRGEIAIVIAPGQAQQVPLEAAVAQVTELTASGTPLKSAAAEVAEATGHPRRALYQAALEAKAGGPRRA